MLSASLMTQTSGITECHQDKSREVKPPDIKKGPTFRGPHLFVHHDAKHMKAEPHRQRVFSHVQGRYKRWKREEETKDLRRSARCPSQDELHSRSLSPTTILARGHSDPFGALPVKIGPKENELIGFYRDVMIPAQYDLPFQVPNLSALREADWADCKGSLQNEGIAHALLARFGQAVSNCTTAYQVVTMEHQHQSTKLLLGKVKPGSELQDFDTYFHINMLFSAETLGRNLKGALAHGKVLRHMFEEAWKQGSLNYKLLLYQLYNDCQVSSMFLVRPIWDVKDWLPMVFAPVWSAAAPYLPTPDDHDFKLDPSLKGELAQAVMTSRELWTVLTGSGDPGPSPAENLAVMGWFLSRSYISHGRLMNYYVDLTESLQSTSLNQPAKRDLLTQQHLTLAAVYLLKVFNRDPKVLGVPLFDARGSLLPALRTSLEEFFSLTKDVYAPEHMNARLWALYVGAMAEQAYPTSGSDPHAQWFNTCLAEQAKKMGVETWDQARDILRGFLYFVRIQPNGATWFERTLEVYEENTLGIQSP